jgi:protocatechuate 3,4-dioxygenase beta subunit
MVDQLKQLDRRELIALLTAAPATLAVLGGCGESSESGNDIGPRVTPDAGLQPDSMTHADAGLQPDSMSISLDAGSTPRDAGAVNCSLTTPDALGPFFSAGAPIREQLAEPQEPGEPLRIEGRLFDVDDCRTPLAGWGLDLWQADSSGEYYDGPSTNYRLRGRLLTDADGRFSFETIKPGNYPLDTSYRPAHIHFRVYSPGGVLAVTSQLYFEGDPYLSPADPCGPPNCFSDDPARIVRLVPTMIGDRMGQIGMLPLFVSDR